MKLDTEAICIMMIANQRAITEKRDIQAAIPITRIVLATPKMNQELIGGSGKYLLSRIGTLFAFGTQAIPNP